MDTYGRLNVVSSTQIVFHVRRIVATALGIPKSKVRVREAQDRRRLWREADGGGGDLSGFCHLDDGKAGQDDLTPGKRCQIASTPRHEMEVTGAAWERMRTDRIRAIDMYTLVQYGSLR